jgi:hypothetical protein
MVGRAWAYMSFLRTICMASSAEKRIEGKVRVGDYT